MRRIGLSGGYSVVCEENWLNALEISPPRLARARLGSPTLLACNELPGPKLEFCRYAEPTTSITGRPALRLGTHWSKTIATSASIRSARRCVPRIRACVTVTGTVNRWRMIEGQAPALLVVGQVRRAGNPTGCGPASRGRKGLVDEVLAGRMVQVQAAEHILKPCSLAPLRMVAQDPTAGCPALQACGRIGVAPHQVALVLPPHARTFPLARIPRVGA